jgi:hypothetical protein
MIPPEHPFDFFTINNKLKVSRWLEVEETVQLSLPIFFPGSAPRSSFWNIPVGGNIPVVYGGSGLPAAMWWSSNPVITIATPSLLSSLPSPQKSFTFAAA